MNNAITRFSLDLNEQDSQVYVTVRQFDTAKKLSVMLKEGGTPYRITDGVSTVLAARTPSGAYITKVCTVSEENRIETVLSHTFTEEAGKYNACFNLTSGSGMITSPPFTIFVDASAVDAT